MLDKRKAAEVILDKIDQKAPVTINWNFKQQWLDPILVGLAEVEKQKPQEAQLPGNQGN